LEGSVQLEAFRGLAVLSEHEDLAAHYNGAAVLVSLYKSIGLKEAPIALRWFIMYAFLLARELKSIKRLHAISCLAISTGVPLPVNQLKSPNLEGKIGPSELKRLKDDFSALNQPARQAGPLLSVHVHCGVRSGESNDAFSSMFFDESVLKKSLADSSANPILDVINGALLLAKSKENLLSELVKIAMRVVEARGSPPRIDIEFMTPFPEKIVDKHGNVFTGAVIVRGQIAFEGRFLQASFGVVDLQPLCKTPYSQEMNWHQNLASQGAAVPAVYGQIGSIPYLPQNLPYSMQNNLQSQPLQCSIQYHPQSHSVQHLQQPVFHLHDVHQQRLGPLPVAAPPVQGEMLSASGSDASTQLQQQHQQYYQPPYYPRPEQQQPPPPFSSKQQLKQQKQQQQQQQKQQRQGPQNSQQQQNYEIAETRGGTPGDDMQDEDQALEQHQFSEVNMSQEDSTEGWDTFLSMIDDKLD